MERPANRRRFLQGQVVSDKMSKTRVVVVTGKAKHVQYGKLMRHSQKYKAHDENNASKVGDSVWMMESRPLSKAKRWVITEVIKGN